jgi:hypothetical protein
VKIIYEIKRVNRLRYFYLLKVLFNQKKDRVIHRGTHGTNATAVSTNIMETDQKLVTPYASVPRSSTCTDIDIDFKQLDLADGSEEIVDQTSQTLQSEAVMHPEKLALSKTDIPLESQNIMTDKNIENNDIFEENIQIEEGSSQILEETKKPEKMKADEIIDIIPENLENEKKQIIKQEENEKLKGDNMNTSIQSNPKSYNHVESKDEIADKTDASNVTQQNILSNANEEVMPFVSRLLRSDDVMTKNNSFDGGEVKNILNGLRHRQQHSLFAAVRTNNRTIKRRHSLNSSQISQNAYDTTPNVEIPKTYVSVKSRYSRISNAKSIVTNIATEEKTNNMASKRTNGDCTVGNKRKYSAIIQASVASVASVGIENSCAQESCVKRRTRSEDRRQSPTDENDPANQATEDANNRLSWPTSDVRTDSTSLNSTIAALSGQDKLSTSATFERRSLGKKATPIKTIRRPSINGANRLQQLRGSFGLRDWDQGRNNRTNNCNDRRTLNRTVAIIGPDTIPQRWLRFVC